ncbi:substrate-binding domain-containing protein [Actinomadura sp. KC06]|uniref:substrate-binding domain-containing protein n=1 Tax=Actinomadura sp. KC06 TaxID=2530369 RepID=UPI001FB80383|nr:substrate-binding domain-containing protein [Actinomadura sp. KC06]
MANDYENDCTGASITISAVGSGPGLDDLRRNPDPGVIAMTDGVESGATPGLNVRPVGLVIFAVVANKNLKLSDLTTAQLRDLFRAAPSSANGSFVVVGRDSGSGTRRTFEQTVLGTRNSDFPASSTCPTAPQSTPVACTVNTNMDLLTYIDRTPNAIGYAEADALTYFPNVRTLSIDGKPATRSATLNGSYHFVATEYLYTAGRPRGLTAEYLAFLTSDPMTARLRDHSYVACSELSGTALAGQCT